MKYLGKLNYDKNSKNNFCTSQHRETVELVEMFIHFSRLSHVIWEYKPLEVITAMKSSEYRALNP